MKYIIVSVKHGTASEPVFWKADAAGYTTLPWAAGMYDEEEVKGDEGYYNNGHSTIAVPLTTKGLERIGFQCSYNEAQLWEHFKTNKL